MSPEKHLGFLMKDIGFSILVWFSEFTSDCDESVVDDKHGDTNGGSMEDEPERRLLAYVDHLAAQRRAKHRAATATMAPSAVGEFVILEAKEMLKLFTKVRIFSPQKIE